MKKFIIYSLVILFFILITTTSNLPPASMTLSNIDYILVEKEKRSLCVYSEGKMLKQYKVALGFSAIGNKEHEGDGKTPEGKYYIISKNPKSSYHLSLKISYPSENDLRIAMSRGLKPGSNIMIHGIRKGFGWIGKYHALLNWTRGCIAVTNQEIEEIYFAVSVGTIIEIKP